MVLFYSLYCERLTVTVTPLSDTPTWYVIIAVDGDPLTATPVRS